MSIENKNNHINLLNPREIFTGNYKKKDDSEFDDEYEVKIPSLIEVQSLANQNRQCKYYYAGIEHCRRKMARFLLKPENQGYKDGFIACKDIVDSHYKCITQNQYGQTLDEAPEESQLDVKNFYQCAFRDLRPIHHCQRFMDGVLREIIKLPGSKISN